MKDFKLDRSLLAVIFLTGVGLFEPLYAGPGSIGGGAGAILCLNPDHSVKSVDLADLVEAEFYESRSLSPLHSETEGKILPWNLQVESILKDVAPFDPELGEQLMGTANAMLWSLGNQSSRMTLSGFDLKFPEKQKNLVFPAPTDLSVERMPPISAGCQLVGAAYYNDADRKLFISPLVWSHLDEKGKAALFLHEVFYRVQRAAISEMKYKLNLKEKRLTSVDTRKLIGLLFEGKYKFLLDGIHYYSDEFKNLTSPFLNWRINEVEPWLTVPQNCQKLSIEVQSQEKCEMEELKPGPGFYYTEKVRNQSINHGLKFIPQDFSENLQERQFGISCATSLRAQPIAVVHCDGQKIGHYNSEASSEAKGDRRVIRLKRMSQNESISLHWKFQYLRF